MAQTAEITPDGWIVTDLRLFRALTGHPPPRPWGYWDQVRSDLPEPIIVGMWVGGGGLTAAGAGLITAAAVTGQWLLYLGSLLLLGGLALLALWVYLARQAVHGIRAHPFATGVIDCLDPHPFAPTIMVVARARRLSGQSVDVAVELPLAREIERAGIPAEVRFLDDPTLQYRPVFAARPVGTRPGGGDAAEPFAAPDRRG